MRLLRRIAFAASLAILATLGACSKESDPYTSTGGAGTGACPAAPATFDCPSGSGDLACGIPASGAGLRASGDDVVLAAAGDSGTTRVLRVTAGGLTPLFTLAPREYLSLVDDGWAYIARPMVGEVVRRKLDSADPAEPFLSCARDFDATFFADAAALYLNSTIGLLRVEKASPPTARLARLYPWGYKLTWFDGQHFYGTPVNTTNGPAGVGDATGGPVVVAESTGASCTCDCSVPGVADQASCRLDNFGGDCNRAPAKLAVEGLTYPVVRGADETSIFVLTMSPYFGTLPTLFRVTKDGKKKTALLGPGSSHESWAPGDTIAVDGGFVYARVSSPDAYRSIRMRTDGTEATVLATSTADQAGRALAIQVTGEGAYFLLSDGTCTAHLVRYAKPTDASDASDGGTDADASIDAEDAPVDSPGDTSSDLVASHPVRYVHANYADAGRPTYTNDMCKPDGDKSSRERFGCNCVGAICDGSGLICDTSATIDGVTYNRHCWCDGQFMNCCDTPAAYYECLICPPSPPTPGTSCQRGGSGCFYLGCPDYFYCDQDTETWVGIRSGGGACPPVGPPEGGAD